MVYVEFKIKIKNTTNQFKLVHQRNSLDWGYTQAEPNIEPGEQKDFGAYGKTMDFSGVSGHMYWKIVHIETNFELGQIDFDFSCPFSMARDYHNSPKIIGRFPEYFTVQSLDVWWSEGGHRTNTGGFQFGINGAKEAGLKQIIKDLKNKPWEDRDL